MFRFFFFKGKIAPHAFATEFLMFSFPCFVNNIAFLNTPWIIPNHNLYWCQFHIFLKKVLYFWEYKVFSKFSFDICKNKYTNKQKQFITVYNKLLYYTENTDKDTICLFVVMPNVFVLCFCFCVLICACFVFCFVVLCFLCVLSSLVLFLKKTTESMIFPCFDVRFIIMHPTGLI